MYLSTCWKFNNHTTLYIPPSNFFTVTYFSFISFLLWWENCNGERAGWGGGGGWLFPEIGLAATLHLHCRDWGFSLAQLKTTQQVNSYITVEQKEKWMVRG